MRFSDMDPVLFSFRVKFYPPDPFRLKEEITRYQVYLQLKRDLLHGRLYCTASEAALLGAYIVQSELGDYDPEEHVGNYVSEMKILLKQTPLIEEKIMELHQTQLKGQTPGATENNFLRKACTLDTYGVDPHPVKKKHTVGFKCPTGAACRHVWRCAIEQMLFFTLPSSSEAPSVVTGGSFFSWGSKFRYSGRVEREILEDTGLKREEPTITRGSIRRKASSVPATPSTPIASDLGYSSLPRSNHSADSRLDSGTSVGITDLASPYNADNSLLPLETVSEDQEVKARVAVNGVNKSVSEPRLSNGKTFIKTGLKDSEQMGSGGGFCDYYFRDSMDHSSSESQLVGASHRSSRSQTPVLRSSKIPLPPALTPARPQPTPTTPLNTNNRVSNRTFNIIRIFVPSFVITAVSLLVIVILVLETDYEILGSLRRAPEMITLRRLYYEPTKEFFKSKFFTQSRSRDT